MGLKLKKFSIERCRGITSYNIDDFGDWSSFTGENSTDKSSIIEGLSILGSNRSHRLSEIPDSFSHHEINLRKIPVKFVYIFELTKNFAEV